MQSFTPTEEQAYALMLYRTAQNVVIEALAGSGKTSTLEHLARYAPTRRGLYLAFNKSVQLEAQRRFAGTQTMPMTINSLAYRATDRRLLDRLNRKERFTPWGVYAKRIGIDDDYRFSPGDQASTAKVRRETLTSCARETATRFMRSASQVMGLEHVALPKALVIRNDTARAALKETILDFAQTIWADFQNPDGDLPYEHDAYMKTWHLADPVLTVDFVMLDEAQDADSLIVDVLLKQQCQKVVVGDRSQAIYGWRTGTIDAMTSVPNAYRALLSQSFRFGPRVADEAQKWLDLLDTGITIHGNPAVQSRVGDVHTPDALICRTNGGAVGSVMSSIKRGRKVGIAGERKAQELVRFAKAAADFKEKGRTSHPDFNAFGSWEEVVDFSESDDGRDYAAIVKTVNRYGGREVIEAVQSCDIHTADLIVSTAHIAKGLEWGRVRVGKDFAEPKLDKTTGRHTLKAEEARLAYVTVTRAKTELDTGSLSWIDNLATTTDLS